MFQTTNQFYIYMCVYPIYLPTRWGPQDSVQLVDVCGWFLWFMVDISRTSYIMGINSWFIKQRSHHWGAHPVGSLGWIIGPSNIGWLYLEFMDWFQGKLHGNALVWDRFQQERWRVRLENRQPTFIAHLVKLSIQSSIFLSQYSSVIPNTDFSDLFGQ